MFQTTSEHPAASPFRIPHSAFRVGFTLIELMVVVAIILLLVAILLPTLDKAQEMAAVTTCAANQRQLQLATTAYAADNFSLYPPFRQALTLNWKGEPDGSDGAGITRLDESLLWPYFRDPDVLMCPTFKAITNDNAIRSYSMNWNAGSTQAGKDNDNEGVGTINKVRQPNTFCIFSEENPWSLPYWGTVGINDADLVAANSASGQHWPTKDTLGTYHLPQLDRYKDASPSGFVPEHQDDILNTGIANVAFADGHVDLVETTMTESVVFNDRTRIKWPQNTPYTP